MGRKASGNGKSAPEGLVVGSKVKAFLKSQGMKTSGDLFAALNGALSILLARACLRAKSNRRTTVRPEDL